MRLVTIPLSSAPLWWFLCFTVHVVAMLQSFFNLYCSFLLIFRCFNRDPNNHGNQIGFHWSHTPTLQHLMLSCSNDCHKGSIIIAQGTALLLPSNMNLLLKLSSLPDYHADTYSFISLSLSLSLSVSFWFLYFRLSVSFINTYWTSTLLIVLAVLCLGKDLVYLGCHSVLHSFIRVFVTCTIGPQACEIIVDTWGFSGMWQSHSQPHVFTVTAS